MREKVKQEKELPLPGGIPTSTAILSPHIRSIACNAVN
jgi:hypothetical protein